MHVTNSRWIVNSNHLNNGCLCCRNLCAFFMLSRSAFLLSIQLLPPLDMTKHKIKANKQMQNSNMHWGCAFTIEYTKYRKKKKIFSSFCYSFLEESIKNPFSFIPLFFLSLHNIIFHKQQAEAQARRAGGWLKWEEKLFIHLFPHFFF